MSTPLRPRTTPAFFIQSVISFAVSLSVTAIISRVDQARLDKLLAEQDLLRVQDH